MFATFMITSTVFVCVLTVLYQLYWSLRIKIKKLPPAPSLLRLVYWVLYARLHGTESEILNWICDTYATNGIISFGTVGNGFTLICSSVIAKKVLMNRNALHRPIFSSDVNILSTADGVKGFVDISGNKWTIRRKLSQSILFRMCTAEFMGKVLDETFTNVIFKELNEICDSHKLWYPSDLMKYCVFNSIFYACCGFHISYYDTLYQSVIDSIDKTFSLFFDGIGYATMPKWMLFFFKLFSRNFTLNTILNVVKNRDALLRDILFSKQKKDKTKVREKAIFYVDYISNELSESEVLADALTLIFAGTHTTSSTINFGIVFCAKYENMQQKVRNELIDCYKRNHQINDGNDCYKRFNINWINELTYFRAFVHETLRVSSITQIGLPHRATNDIKVNGDDGKQYCIPKGYIIFYNIEMMHKYSKTRENWTDSSDKICLENWINPETMKFEINKSFMTFGAGRRDCVGKGFAIKQIYIIMANLLLNYEFSLKDKDQEIQTVSGGVNAIDPPIGV
eukprot:243718_1